jgi:hypothetical protein
MSWLEDVLRCWDGWMELMAMGNARYAGRTSCPYDS